MCDDEDFDEEQESRIGLDEWAEYVDDDGPNRHVPDIGPTELGYPVTWPGTDTKIDNE